MVTDLEKLLKDGTKVERAVEIVSDHWKTNLKKGMYKLCKERNKEERKRLIKAYSAKESSPAPFRKISVPAYSAKESQPAPSRKIAVQKRRQNNRWESLWLPRFAVCVRLC